MRPSSCKPTPIAIAAERPFAGVRLPVAAALIGAAAALVWMAFLGAATASAQVAGVNAGVEAVVREAFADVPSMVAVARCESGFRQFAAEGTVLRGGAGRGYLGTFQIGEQLHRAPAAALGHDIDTLAGNIAYARHLFDQSGTTPWRECVPPGGAVTAAEARAMAAVRAARLAAEVGDDAVDADATAADGQAPLATTGLVTDSFATTGETGITTPATTSVVATTEAVALTVVVPPMPRLTADLVLGARGEQVLALQRALNARGFTIAASGAGSPGSETNYFGALTRDALRRFQCAQSIVCAGSEATTGYGRLGPRTRAALNGG